MSSNETNCCPQKIEEATQTRDDKKNFTLLSNLKPEDEENFPNFLPSSELSSCDASFPIYSIKTEPEDLLQFDFQSQAENVALKEDVDMEEHKPGWELTRRSNAGTIKDEPSVQRNELKTSGSKREGKLKYNCTHCPYKTNKTSNYIRHYNCKHSQEADVYKCEECSYETRRKSDLVKHYKLKHAKEAEVYKCRECSYETRNKCNLTEHYKYNHAKDARLYKCGECSFETRRKGDVTRHYKCKHATQIEVYKCEECSYEARLKVYLNRHYRRNHLK